MPSEILDHHDVMTNGRLVRTPNAPPFSLKLNLTSGQTFRWGFWLNGKFVYGKPNSDGYWCSTKGNVVICLKEEKNYLNFIASNSVIKFWRNKTLTVKDFLFKFLRRDEDLTDLRSVFVKSTLTRNLPSKFPGLVVLRQDPYETLVSFVLSPMNRVERIAQTINQLAVTAGRPIVFDGKPIYTIPTPEEVLDADLSKVSFRYPNIQPKRLKEMAKFLINNPDIFDDCKGMSYKDAWKTLQEIPGVGPKIADCILLYSLDFLEAVPVDVHIYRRTASMFPHLFNSRKKPTYLEIGEIWRKVFHKYAGVVQLYVFMDARRLPHSKDYA